ncbi:MAG: hypothetical protein UY27_C0023G0007 [Candidatus Gottesmanbacteria bacterium GW2011_GWA1_48_13]|uniref:Uncharacterized protein n=1 Tax=Candidatus Gottesmanbacteria bacterium GW2011_GWA1_48_13 TaxID=1618439 RepID=A0A0G1UMD9_9BACT|nr:MAG: hypothetical protein UY27_C0023G0007 [Candidatus Gottesmanbacteria bacterium GW2011_GWA1_48_13]
MRTGAQGVPGNDQAAEHLQSRCRAPQIMIYYRAVGGVRFRREMYFEKLQAELEPGS